MGQISEYWVHILMTFLRSVMAYFMYHAITSTLNSDNNCELTAKDFDGNDVFTYFFWLNKVLTSIFGDIYLFIFFAARHQAE